MNAVLKDSQVDLIILDVLMPGDGGLEICRRLRQTTDIPVILLTAVLDDTEKIVGLELGADDYVTKPFIPRELLARVSTVLRLGNALPNQYADFEPCIILFAGLKVDLGEQGVTNEESGTVVPLSSMEFRLLMSFLANPKIVLSRDLLLERVTNRTSEAFDRSIDNQVSRLRKKIDPDTKNPRIIKTVWGGGYMLIAEVVKL